MSTCRSPRRQTPRPSTLTIDGREVTVPEGTTIWTAARDAGIDIPVLCHDERFDPVGRLPDVRGRRRRPRASPRPACAPARTA